MNEKNEKELTEYHLASFLLTKGYKLKRIEFKTPYAKQTGTFVFEDDGFIDNEITNFWDNEKINIQDFINSLRLLKHRLQQAMYENGVYKYGIRKNFEKENNNLTKTTQSCDIFKEL